MKKGYELLEQPAHGLWVFLTWKTYVLKNGSTLLRKILEEVPENPKKIASRFLDVMSLLSWTYIFRCWIFFWAKRDNLTMVRKTKCVPILF